MSLTNSLVSYFTLDSVPYDSTGSNPGVVSGATFAAGKIKGGLSFSSLTTDNISISGLGSVFTQAGTYSVSCWVYQRATGVNMNVWNFSGGGSNRHNLNLDSATGLLGFQLYNGTTYSGFRASPISINEWHHFVCISAARTLTVYLDGVALSNSGGNNYAVTNGGNVLLLGYPNNTTNDSKSFDGIIDEVGVWNVALSSDDVRLLYNGGSGLQYPFGWVVNFQ